MLTRHDPEIDTAPWMVYVWTKATAAAPHHDMSFGCETSEIAFETARHWTANGAYAVQIINTNLRVRVAGA